MSKYERITEERIRKERERILEEYKFFKKLFRREVREKHELGGAKKD